MYVALERGRLRILGVLLASVLAATGLLIPQSGWAAPKLRYQTDVKGDIIAIGNTLGQDCRANDAQGTAIPKPVVGNVGACGDPLTIDDSAPDVLWRADDGMARADSTLMIDQARSSAMLSIPQGSQVVYARLYWGGNLSEDVNLASGGVSFEKVGAFSMTVAPNNPAKDVSTTLGGGGGYVYQSSADVTSILQRHGSGSYRVGNVVRRNIINRDEDVQFNAWTLLVVFRNDKEPVRNITLYDGLDGVDIGRNVSLGVIGFRVPEGGVPQGKLGVIGYEGDPDKKDTILFNNIAISDPVNPANNIFNSTRSDMGMPMSVAGDLPQLTGTAGSMSGLDLDMIDISAMLKADDIQASVQANSVDDVYFVGALYTSIRSRKPVIETTLNADPGTVRPGDEVTFTSTSKNVGDDDGTDIVIRHPIPDGLTYVPGSIRVVSGPEPGQNGPKSDREGDDQAEVIMDPMTGKPVLVIRIGKGANGTMGGRLTPNEAPVVVEYKLKTDKGAMGKIPTQSQTTAGTGGNPALPPATFPSGNGMQPGAPTVVNVPTGAADLRIIVTKDPPNAQPDMPVTYSVDVKNVGTSTDPGPINVKVQIPPGGKIDAVKPGPGWTCTQQDRTVMCNRQTPMPPGETSRAVDVTVRNPNGPTMDNEVTGSVISEGAYDPNPADNLWSELGGGGNLRIAGGGIGCSLSPAGSTSGLGIFAGIGVALAVLAMLRRRSHQQSGSL